MIPSTVERVPQHTRAAYNEAIRRQTEANVARFAAAGPAASDRRLAELDREWDIERTLEANAATVSLIGSALGSPSARMSRSRSAAPTMTYVTSSVHRIVITDRRRTPSRTARKRVW